MSHSLELPNGNDPAGDGPRIAFDAATLRIVLDRILPPSIVADLQSSDKPRRELIAALGSEDIFRPCIRGISEDDDPRSAHVNVRALATLIEQLALQNCWGLTLSVALHVGVFLPLIARLAHPVQRQMIIASAAAGRLLGAVAATDLMAAGSDFMGMETTATFDGPSIILRGTKTFITSATIADYAVVFARWRPGRHFSNFCSLLVPLDQQGVLRRAIPMEVMRGAGVGSLTFNDVRLPEHALLGRRELGMRYFLDHIGMERLIAGVWALAIGERELRDTQKHLLRRQIGAASLWQRDAVRQRLAESIAQLALLRSLVSETLIEADANGFVDPLRSAIIKATAPATLERIIGTCLQFHGAAGLSQGNHLLRSLTELRAFAIGGGSTETMLELIANSWPFTKSPGGWLNA
ncbi:MULTISPECIES: acyl-CoA dehydrogenase family protein [unclassified Bradyrhizobium]|uniref:acyl-CoA dehydrogenase family protein n=1 Tax=unclassified Bradyrhizobium TaxID=2631580 RepID=UPI00291691CA|nr:MULTISPECIES: acyl-CoA dehydrogenase family protein [unclassified Bradyrhizobium]